MILKHICLSFVLWGIAGPACDAGGENPAGGLAWTSRAAMPIPRMDHALIELDGALYAIGGYSGSTLARVDRYDPATDRWQRRADLHTPRREFAAGVINGKIYVACGLAWNSGDDVVYIDTTEEYDPQTDTWTEKATCPLGGVSNGVTGNVAVGGTAAGGMLYVVQRYPEGVMLQEYDPAQDRWTERTPPADNHHFSAAALGDTMYLLSSPYNPEGYFQSLARYDTADDTWVLRSTPEGDALEAVVATTQGLLYAVGGVIRRTEAENQASSLVRVYDSKTDIWRVVGTMSQARYRPGVAIVGGRLYATGGGTGTFILRGLPTDSVEATEL